MSNPAQPVSSATIFIIKVMILTLIFLLAEWSYFAFTGTSWQIAFHILLASASLVGIPNTALWKRLPLPKSVHPFIVPIVLWLIMIVIFTLSVGNGFDFYTRVFIAYCALIAFISWTLRDANRANASNLVATLVSTAIMFIIIEVTAPSIQSWISEQQRAAVQAQSAPAPTWDELAFDPIDMRPVASPVTNIIEQGPGPSWGPPAGWGTRINARVERSLAGEFDVLLTYNSKGLRGEEFPYDKPDDVFRILMIGDSFLEAREVNDEDIIYHQLNEMLDNYRTPDGRRVEVIGAGTTGWGTAQSYLYYQIEGYRYEPDIVLNVFVINDVVDNYPAQFYPERGIDFDISEAGVTLISSENAQPRTQPVVSWLNALPPAMQSSNTVNLLRQVFIPPLTPITVISEVEFTHPQDYIYLRQPSLDGYPEAWQRTETVYNLWNTQTQANDTQLMVMTVDVGLSYIRGVIDRHVDQPEWVWDVDLPQTRLSDILEPLDVPLLNTRDAYTTYATENDALVRAALFFPTDGHWNPTGHRVTAQYLLDTWLEQGIIEAN
ncbi:MAG: hypothetical protein AAFR81_02690 [Chloroflexota bacterium]